MKSWIQTFSGQAVDPRQLDPAAVRLEDIAHALACKTRFTGHARAFYSVAQHTIIGAAAIAEPFKLPFLLHEVSEAYLPDIAAPLKPHLRVLVPMGEAGGAGGLVTWPDLEHQHARAVFEALGIPGELPALYSPTVKEMDLRMLVTEARDLMAPPPREWWPAGTMPAPLPETLIAWPWDTAEAVWLVLARRLLAEVRK